MPCYCDSFDVIEDVRPEEPSYRRRDPLPVPTDLTLRVEALEKSVHELAMSCAALFEVVKGVVDRNHAAVDPAAGGAA